MCVGVCKTDVQRGLEVAVVHMYGGGDGSHVQWRWWWLASIRER